MTSSLSSHQSGDVSMASFLRLHSCSSQLPSMLCSLEEHNFLFQLQARERPPEDAKEVRRKIQQAFKCIYSFVSFNEVGGS